MDDFNRLATLDEIETHYASLDVPIPICWLLNGKLDYLEEETEVQVTFTQGEIRDESLDLTANYTLMRYENGYMVYNFLIELNDFPMITAGTIEQSGDLFYDVELPVHFKNSPMAVATYCRKSYGLYQAYVDFNSSHLIDYIPVTKITGVSSSWKKADGYVCLKVEGF